MNSPAPSADAPAPAAGRGTGWAASAAAAAAGFVAYFAMYGFRKPFAAAEYAGESFFDSGVELKTAFAVSQIVGYALSKYLGVLVCGRIPDRWRGLALVGLIAVAEGALLLFGALPADWKAAALFLNGLPLGMVWGLVVRYLEGRTSSDVLLSALCCSFILSSGVVKDAGRAWLAAGVDPYWMPAVTGACFLPVFLLAVWGLSKLPAPTATDRADRRARGAADWPTERRFLRDNAFALVPLLVFYIGLTSFREFRDIFAVEVLAALGAADGPAVFTKIETPVGLAVTGALALLVMIGDHRRALGVIVAAMAAGVAIVGAATLALRAGAAGPLLWMTLIGLGAYLAYVPMNAVFFERLVALRGGGRRCSASIWRTRWGTPGPSPCN